MADQNATSLPLLDMSTSVPLNQTPSAQTSALPKLDMSTSVPIDQQTSAAPAPGTIGVTGFLNKVGEGAAEGASDIYGAVAPAILHPIDSTVAAAKGVWNSLPPVELVNSVKQTLPLIHAYETARSSGASVSDALTAVNEAAKQHISNIAPLKAAVDNFRANPVRETARAVTDAAAVAASMFAGGGEVAAPEEAAAATAPAEAEVAGSPSWLARNNPFRKPFTSPAGLRTATAQPAAQAAVRGAVGAEAEAPILQGAKTVVDEPLADLATKKTAAYKQIDDAVGFDLKEEKSKLADTQYAIKQPGADKTALQSEIDESTQRIADANTKLAAAKIDPKVADQLNTSWSAGRDYRKVIVRSTASDGTVDVNKLLNQSKGLRFTKYGDRLAQFFGSGDIQAGKAAADKYISGLEQAQKTGQMFMDARDLRNSLLKWGLVATGAGAVGHFIP